MPDEAGRRTSGKGGYDWVLQHKIRRCGNIRSAAGISRLPSCLPSCKPYLSPSRNGKNAKAANDKNLRTE